VRDAYDVEAIADDETDEDTLGVVVRFVLVSGVIEGYARAVVDGVNDG
jgi:hypothetical protein